MESVFRLIIVCMAPKKFNLEVIDVWTGMGLNGSGLGLMIFPLFFPFLPIPYPFRRLLRRLTKSLLMASSLQWPLFLGVQSIHWFLFKPPNNGHLSAIATATKLRPPLPKQPLKNGQFFISDWQKSQEWLWNLIHMAC